ncbi:topoisomerase IV, partial [Clostridium botulinum]|nr:topoisomerase IV [Clostridium botulinum]
KKPSIMIPTFPTGGELIYNEKELINIKNFGRGKIVLRATYYYKDNNIIISSIPYTTTREVIIEKIISMVKKGNIKDIIDINDNTGRCGLKITIKVKKNCDKDQLMSMLFKRTTLQDTFNCNFNVLDNGVPKVLGTDDIIKKWIIFRQSCIRNKVQQDIDNKNNKLNILLGLKEVLLDIDKTIDIIRNDNNSKDNLIKLFSLNMEQVEYVLNMKVRNINKGYILKQIDEIDSLQKEVDYLVENINNTEYINKLIKEDLVRVKKEYSYKRKTEIIYEDTISEIKQEDLIEDFTTTLILTEQQYFKKTKKYSENQKLKEDDTITTMIQDSNRNKVMFLSDKGNMYLNNLYELDENTPSSLGQYLPNLLPLDKDETILGMVSSNNHNGYVLIVYEDGHAVRIPLLSYKTKTNRTKLSNCLADIKPILITQITDDINIELTDTFDKTKLIKTEDIPIKTSRNSQGKTMWNSKKQGFKIVSSKII